MLVWLTVLASAQLILSQHTKFKVKYETKMQTLCLIQVLLKGAMGTLQTPGDGTGGVEWEASGWSGGNTPTCMWHCTGANLTGREMFSVTGCHSEWADCGCNPGARLPSGKLLQYRPGKKDTSLQDCNLSLSLDTSVQSSSATVHVAVMSTSLQRDGGDGESGESKCSRTVGCRR